MKRWQTVLSVAAVVVPGALWAGSGVAFINVGEERRFPVAWSRPEFVIVNGVVSFTPPVPTEWETRIIGFEFTIEFAAVKPFLLANHLAPITPDIRIRNAAGKEQQVAAARRYQRLNGQLFEPLGTLDGRVYFKHVSSGKLCSLSMATAAAAPTAAATPAGRVPKPLAAVARPPATDGQAAAYGHGRPVCVSLPVPRAAGGRTGR